MSNSILRIIREILATLAVAASLTEGVSCAYAEQTNVPKPGERVCLVWDVRITTQIEDHGARRTVSSELLAQAAFKQIDARVLCKSGRADEGVRLYESIKFPACAVDACVKSEPRG